MRTERKGAQDWAMTYGLLGNPTERKSLDFIADVVKPYTMNEWKQFQYMSGANVANHVTIENGNTMYVDTTFTADPKEVDTFGSDPINRWLIQAKVSFSFDVNRDFDSPQSHFPMCFYWSNNKYIGATYTKTGAFEVYKKEGSHELVVDFPDFEAEGRPTVYQSFENGIYRIKCGSLDFEYDTGWTDEKFAVAMIWRQQVSTDEHIKDFKILEYKEG